MPSYPSPASPSLLPTTPISPPRRLSLLHSTPFINSFDTPFLHLTSSKQVSPSTLFDPSPSLSLRSASVGIAYLAERRAVDLVKVLDLAGLGIAFEGGKRLVLTLEEERLASPLYQEFDQAPTSALPLPSQPQSAMSSQLHSPANDLRTPHTSSPPSSDLASPDTQPLPPVDQSFMRWSKTASMIFSDQSAFYYNGRRSTGQFSDFSPALPETSSPQVNMSHPPTSARPVAKRRESTNSAGTFGCKQRRWSAVHSVASVSTPPTDFGPPASTEAYDEISQADDEDSKSGSTASRPKIRRPLSMSSASDSTFSGAPYHAGERVHVGRSSVPAATFPSPTLRRPAHKTPESEAEITAHLLKASGKNESRIVPRLLPPFSPTKPGPTVGTPIYEEVREESSTYGDSEDGAKRRERRKTSKLDQILGEGAETARVLMEFDRRAVGDVVDVPSMTRLPPPPRHKPSASVPSISSIPILAPPTPYNASPTRSRFSRTEHIYPSPSRVRSTSLDSIPSSLNPSLTDSTHTLARLLPTQPPTPAYPVPRVPAYPAQNLPKPEVRNDLSPEQRAMLVRRTRKIEHLLGESLGEARVGQHVVGPSTALPSVYTSHESDWPSSPTSSARRGIPEYERQDCLPRTIRVGNGPLPGGPQPAGKNGGSKLAMKAMAALGLGSGTDKKEEEDLRVYVSREKTVAEYISRDHHGAGGKRMSEETGLQSSLDSPRSPIEDAWEDEGDIQRRNKRMQAAKLNRLLGVPVPSSALQTNQSSLNSTPSPTSNARPRAFIRAPSASDLSFISFDEDQPSTSWTKRMKSVVNGNKDKDKGLWGDDTRDKAKKGSPPRFFGSKEADGSFMDLKDAKKVSRGGLVGGGKRKGSK